MILDCPSSHFHCTIGNCIYSDEPDCYGPCIPQGWVDDGEIDCSDESDESGTRTTTYATAITKTNSTTTTKISYITTNTKGRNDKVVITKVWAIKNRTDSKTC